ncbi:MAG: PAS domain-containing protein [Alphaproteobacteria bacterium]|nr:PAS domain-containing protein [Alphaproteobacteria bacterium]
MPLSSDPNFVASKKVHALLDYWNARRQGKEWPSRVSIMPWEIAPYLPNVVISEINIKTRHVYYRLVGTKVAEMSRFDFTGRWLHEMQLASQETRIWDQAYAMIIETGSPVYGHTGIPISDGSEILVEEEFGMFPLQVPNTEVFQCLALEDYGAVMHFDPDELRAMRPVKS